MWRVIELRPLDQAFFRPPAGVTQAGVHGPSATVRSLSYPMPSTIAGALAGMAYKRDLCRPRAVEGFKDQYECLEALLGRGFILRPGLLRIGGEVYAYTGTPRVHPLRDLLYPSHGDDTEAEGVEIPHASYTGIALDRMSKSVIEGNLYHMDSVDYPSIQASILVLYKGTGSRLDNITVLGAETRTALVRQDGGVGIEDLMTRVGESRERHWEAILLTPALLPGGVEPRGRAIIAGQAAASRIARALLEAANSDCIEELQVKRVPRGELQMEVLNAGWSMHAGGVREPYLMLPPGTVLRVTPRSHECLPSVVESGLGAHSRLGWGTVILRPERRQD